MNPKAFAVHASGAALILLLCARTVVLAGPPLATEDAGILDPGQWEIIAAASGESRPERDSANFPLLDVSYGLTTNTQLAVVVSRQQIKDAGESTKSGWGNGEIGYKWRFFNNGAVEMAVGAKYSHPLDRGSTVRGLVEDIKVLSLPYVLTYTTGDWSWNFQAGYAITSKSVNAWDYGAAVGRQVGPAQLLFEIWGVADEDFDENATNYRVGIDYGLSESTHILAAVGSSLTSDLPSDAELDWDFYLGIQWFR